MGQLGWESVWGPGEGRGPRRAELCGEGAGGEAPELQGGWEFHRGRKEPVFPGGDGWRGGGGGGCKGVAGEKETFPEPPYQGGPESLFWRKQRHQIEFAGSWDSGLGADARTWKAWLRADSWMEKTSRERRDLGCRSQAIGSQRSGGERA